MTLICNIISGPSSGKTTTSNHIFAIAKEQHMKCEVIYGTEKEIIYDENLKQLKCQPLILGLQLWKIERLFGKVDFIINDLPLPLNIIYNCRYPESFNRAVMDIFNSHNNLNIFLERPDTFDNFGRVHDLKESIEIDKKILKLMVMESIPFVKVKCGAAKQILELIKRKLYNV